MEIKTNPAKRIHHILKQAKNDNSGHVYHRVWANIFEIDPVDTHKLNRCFSLFHDEMNALNKLIVDCGFKYPEGQEDIFKTQIYNVVSYGIYNQPWNSRKDSLITPEMLTALNTFSSFLPDDKYVPNDSDNEAIIKCIKDLKSALNVESITPTMKHIMERLIDQLEMCLISSSVRGAIVYKHVFNELTGAVVLCSDEVTNANESVKAAILAGWSKLKELNTAISIYEKIEKYAKNIMVLLGGE